MATDILGLTLGNAWLDLLHTAGGWLALHVDDPSVTGTSELAGGDYLRQAIAFSAPSAKATVSTNGQLFTGLPNCVVRYLGVWSAQAGGDFWFAKALTPAVTVALHGHFVVTPADFALAL